MNAVAQPKGGDAALVRPFQVNFPESQLTELRRRIGATQWPDRETVTDQSQGPQLATMQKLARYWETEYDWRKVEARLNAVPADSGVDAGTAGAAGADAGVAA